MAEYECPTNEEYCYLTKLEIGKENRIACRKKPCSNDDNTWCQISSPTEAQSCKIH